MRLIDVEVLANWIDGSQRLDTEHDYEEVARYIEECPTVDAVPVRHGRWVKSGQSFVYPHKFRNYSCSVCGYDIEKTKYNYCPNCGARMDGGVDDAVD